MKFAEMKRKEALAKSSVKIKGNDVVASWKLLVGVFLVPVIIQFTCLIFFFTYSKRYASTFLGRWLATTIFGWLIAAYLVYCVQLLNGVKTNFRIVMVRFFVILYRRRIQNLRKVRKDLKRQVKDVMDKYSKINDHTLIKRKSMQVSGEKNYLELDTEEIFGALEEFIN